MQHPMSSSNLFWRKNSVRGSLPVSHIQSTPACLFVLMWAAGLGVATSATILLVGGLVTWPGVFAVRRLQNRESPLSSTEAVILGAPLGLILAIISQQLFLALQLGTFGWLAPVAVTILLRALVSKSANLINPTSRPVVHPIIIAAAFVLADMDWAFLIAGLAGVLGIILAHKRIPMYLLVGLVLTRISLDKYWFLISDDRLFEDAYSRSIHNFGFWDWYGSSSTWVPYHWLGHGIGGLAQTVPRIDSLQAVGVVPAVVSSLIIASSSLLLLARLVPGETTQVKLLALVPLLGVLIRGVSNSADISIALGIWTLALTYYFLEDRFRQGLGPALVILATIGLILAKVSTAVVVVFGIVAIAVAFGIRERQIRKNLRFISVLGMIFLFVVIMNYDVIGIFTVNDSRSNVSFELGGFLGLNGYGRSSAVLITAVALLCFLFLPLMLVIHALRHNRRESPIVIGAAAILVAGWLIRVLLRTYNNESYVEAAVACTTPILLGSVAAIAVDAKKKMFTFSLMVAGAFAGFIQEVFKLKGSSLWHYDIVRVMGLLPLVPMAVTLVLWLVLKISSNFNRYRAGTSMVSFAAVVLLSSGIGGDVFRIGLQVGTGTVWAATNFGSSDAFYFGSGDEESVAQWIRKYSKSSDVVGTNRICPTLSSCSLDGQSAVASWTQRRTYIEAERFITGRSVDEVSDGEFQPQGHPRWITERKTLCIDFGRNQSDQLKMRLIRDGVRWFWLDLTVNNASLTGNAPVVFRSGNIVLLKLF